MTMKDNFLKALIGRGGAEVATKSRKYVRVDCGGRSFYLGSSGSLRVTSVGGPIAGTVPVTTAMKKALLKEAEGKCSYPECKCLVMTSTSHPVPECKRGLAR